MTEARLLAEPAVLKACCADLWAHPGIRLLAGEALRPGGLELTARALDVLRLAPGARVLDVGCGAGATLGLLRARGFAAVGLDYSATLAAQAAQRAPTARGDAERLPFRSRSLDAVLMECVLSAVPDKAAAASELGRVLIPGGTLLLSDVTREGRLPEPLDSLAGWIACAGGALTADGYRGLLSGAGFTVEVEEDHRAALAALVTQARRRLALLEGALGAGLVDPEGEGLDLGLIRLGHALLAQAADAVSAGALGYVVIVARRP